MQHTGPMTTQREDRRPDWLRHKHTAPSPVDAEVRELFEQFVVQALDARRPIRLSDIAGVTFGTDDEARDEGRLIYNTARRLGLSAASRVTDPVTGRCELCDGGWSSGQRCQPSPRGGFDLHFSVFAKKTAYAYMLDHYGPDRAKWPYDPLAKRGPRGQAEPAVAASPPAGRRFGAGDKPPEPDPPQDLRAIGVPRTPRPTRTPATTRGPGSAKAAKQAAEGESLPDRLRRFLG
jgi:hypothetical protein